MRTIEVDFDVYKELTARRPAEDISENDVLRELLGLPRKAARSVEMEPAAGDWISKGVRFPEGTELRAVYKGKTHLARVEGGALNYNGRRYDSPSPAAIKITGAPVNGWTFWQCRLPGRSNWQSLKSIREQR